MQFLPGQTALLYTAGLEVLLQLLPVVVVAAAVLRPQAAPALAMLRATSFSTSVNSTVSALLVLASSRASPSCFEIWVIWWAVRISAKRWNQNIVLQSEKFLHLKIWKSEVLEKRGPQCWKETSF
jgi:hypothetical protein